MFEKMVLAVDGSEGSRRAIACAAELAKEAKGELLVVHVREHEVVRGGPVDMETPADAKALVDGVVKELEAKGIKVKGQVFRATFGRAASAILDAAKESGSDLIITGSRGLTDLQGLVLGSVTHKLIHLSKIPILVAR